jgi:hypothetical protein
MVFYAGSRFSALGSYWIFYRPGLEDSWQHFGTDLEDNAIDRWHGGSDPMIAKNGDKGWITLGV